MYMHCFEWELCPVQYGRHVGASVSRVATAGWRIYSSIYIYVRGCQTLRPLVFRISSRFPVYRCDGPLEGQSGSGDRSLGGDRGGRSQRAGPLRDEGGGLRQERGPNQGLN